VSGLDAERLAGVIGKVLPVKGHDDLRRACDRGSEDVAILWVVRHGRLELSDGGWRHLRSLEGFAHQADSSSRGLLRRAQYPQLAQHPKHRPGRFSP